MKQKKAEMRPMRPPDAPQGLQIPRPPSFHLQLWDLLVASRSPVSHCLRSSFTKETPKTTFDLGYQWVSMGINYQTMNQCWSSVMKNYQLGLSIILQLLTSHHSLLWRKSAMKSSGGRLLRFATSMRWKVLVISPMLRDEKKYLWALSLKKMEN